jgi:hypothetical protein
MDQEWLRKFRMAVAGVCRDLMRAAELAGHKVLDDAARVRWQFKYTKRASKSVKAYLWNACRNLAKISGNWRPASWPDNAVPPYLQLGSLFSKFITLKQVETVLDKLRRRKRVSWKKLARWELLPEIRELLDKLPAPHPVEHV